MSKDAILNIVNKISVEVNIEKNKAKQSPIDNIQIMRDFMRKKSHIIKNLNENISLLGNSEFDFIYDTIISESYYTQIQLSNNHYDNLFLNIYFILGNPYLFNLDIFNILYEKRNELRKIPKIIKKCWNKILKSELRNFFNQTLIEKWIKTSDFKMLTKEEVLNVKTNTEDIYNKYFEIYCIFHSMNTKTRKLIFKLKNEITTNQHPGLFNLKNNEYLFYIRIYTGLDLNYTKINILVKWATKELNRLCTNMTEIISRVRPELANYKFEDIIKILQDDPIYKYKSKEEFVKHHLDIMNSMHDFFINQKGIKEFVEPKLTEINDPNLAGAYWAYDTFYLNVTNWNKINKYQALALTLHEAVPGHHTQVSYSVYSESNGYDVLYSWLGMNSGFHEGWALFTEQLSPSYTDMERVGQIQYEMLRTIRIIVDIAIHVGGIPLDKIIKFMLKYLAMPEESIESEVYRYVVLPAQALGYKLGSSIIKKIHQNVVGGENLLSDASIELYKKIIYDKDKPLEILMKNYNITFEDVFYN